MAMDRHQPSRLSSRQLGDILCDPSADWNDVRLALKSQGRGCTNGAIMGAITSGRDVAGAVHIWDAVDEDGEGSATIAAAANNKEHVLSSSNLMLRDDSAFMDAEHADEKKEEHVQVSYVPIREEVPIWEGAPRPRRASRNRGGNRGSKSSFRRSRGRNNYNNAYHSSSLRSSASSISEHSLTSSMVRTTLTLDNHDASDGDAAGGQKSNNIGMDTLDESECTRESEMSELMISSRRGSHCSRGSRCSLNSINLMDFGVDELTLDDLDDDESEYLVGGDTRQEEEEGVVIGTNTNTNLSVCSSTGSFLGWRHDDEDEEGAIQQHRQSMTTVDDDEDEESTIRRQSVTTVDSSGYLGWNADGNSRRDSDAISVDSCGFLGWDHNSSRQKQSCDTIGEAAAAQDNATLLKNDSSASSHHADDKLFGQILNGPATEIYRDQKNHIIGSVPAHNNNKKESTNSNSHHDDDDNGSSVKQNQQWNIEDYENPNDNHESTSHHGPHHRTSDSSNFLWGNFKRIFDQSAVVLSSDDKGWKEKQVKTSDIKDALRKVQHRCTIEGDNPFLEASSSASDNNQAIVEGNNTLPRRHLTRRHSTVGMRPPVKGGNNGPNKEFPTARPDFRRSFSGLSIFSSAAEEVVEPPKRSQVMRPDHHQHHRKSLSLMMPPAENLTRRSSFTSNIFSEAQLECNVWTDDSKSVTAWVDSTDDRDAIRISRKDGNVDIQKECRKLYSDDHSHSEDLLHTIQQQQQQLDDDAGGDQLPHQRGSSFLQRASFHTQNSSINNEQDQSSFSGGLLRCAALFGSDNSILTTTTKPALDRRKALTSGSLSRFSFRNLLGASDGGQQQQSNNNGNWNDGGNMSKNDTWDESDQTTWMS